MCESEICRFAMDVLVNLGSVVIFLAGVWFLYLMEVKVDDTTRS